MNNNSNEPFTDPRNSRGDFPRGGRPGAGNRGGRGGRGSRPDFSQNLDRELQTVLGNVISMFAPEAGPGLSWFDFNPDAVTPASEIWHDGSDLVVRLELPGVTLDSISVELEGNRLVVSGEKKNEFASEDKERKLYEIRYGTFKRVYPVPTKVDASDVKASLSEGVLTIRVENALRKSEGIKIAVEEGA